MVASPTSRLSAVPDMEQPLELLQVPHPCLPHRQGWASTNPHMNNPTTPGAPCLASETWAPFGPSVGRSSKSRESTTRTCPCFSSHHSQKESAVPTQATTWGTPALPASSARVGQHKSPQLIFVFVFLVVIPEGNLLLFCTCFSFCHSPHENLLFVSTRRSKRRNPNPYPISDIVAPNWRNPFQ
jgi:hypothetical protein